MAKVFAAIKASTPRTSAKQSAPLAVHVLRRIIGSFGRGQIIMSYPRGSALSFTAVSPVGRRMLSCTAGAHSAVSH
ncbi:MAG: hypothetical protein HC869_13045 [Rhodospirillales bacterium]|nr:hypothetical protein [Rhodospirillales bacterium]